LAETQKQLQQQITIVDSLTTAIVEKESEIEDLTTAAQKMQLLMQDLETRNNQLVSANSILERKLQAE
jgi:hypothetical protein